MAQNGIGTTLVDAPEEWEARGTAGTGRQSGGGKKLEGSRQRDSSSVRYSQCEAMKPAGWLSLCYHITDRFPGIEDSVEPSIARPEIQ